MITCIDIMDMRKEKLTIADARLKVEKWKKEGFSVDEIDKMLKSVGNEYE